MWLGRSAARECYAAPVPPDAPSLVFAYAALQRRIVQAFLAHYQPADRDSFSDVPPGTFVVDGETWRQHRHGLGVSFVHPRLGLVNAHVGLAAHPGAVDQGRLVDYLQSQGVKTLQLEEVAFQVSHTAMNALLRRMQEAGTMRRLDCCLPDEDHYEPTPRCEA